MYSDDGSDIFVYDYNSSFGDNDNFWSDDHVERQINQREDGMFALNNLYYYTFEEPHGFFRTEFPDLYVEAEWDDKSKEAIPLPNFFELLHEEDTPEADQLERGCIEETLTSAAVPAAESETAALRLCIPVTPARTDAGEASPCNARRGTTISRFIEDHFDCCIFIPVEEDVNRAALREMHADDIYSTADAEGNVEPLDFRVEYKGGVSLLWALPLTADAAVLLRLQSRHPGWRRATAEDVQLFMRVVKSGAPGVRPTIRSSAGSGTTAASLMRSPERLRSRIEAIGGWGQAIFVAVDVEAFALRPGGIPLPAEVAFVTAASPFLPVDGSATAPPDYHAFLSPGTISPYCQYLSLIQHICVNIHWIPYCQASFLQRDYVECARQIEDRYLGHPNVILINKGAPTSPATVDLHALRMVYAAAAWQLQHRDGEAAAAAEPIGVGNFQGPVPSVEELWCFDISVLEAVIRTAFPGAAVKTPSPATSIASASKSEEATDAIATLDFEGEGGVDTCIDPSRAKEEEAGEGEEEEEDNFGVGGADLQNFSSYCWYHGAAQAFMGDSFTVHCAVKDARKLARRMEAALAAAAATSPNCLLSGEGGNSTEDI